MAFTVGLIDSHIQFREGLKEVLEAKEVIRVIAEGQTGDEIIELYEEHKPDVLLVDPAVPYGDHIELVSQLIEKHPEAKVAIFSTWDGSNLVSRALLAGASGFMLKEMDIRSIVQALEIIAKGESYLHPRVTPYLLSELRRLSEIEESSRFYQPRILRPYYLLSRREVEVLELLAEGFSNRAIADTLFISEKTVKNHVSKILDKLHVADRTQAVVLAIKKGWVKI